MVICNWCQKKFSTHAKLYVHHLIVNDVPNCPKHPDIKPDLEYVGRDVWGGKI